MVTALNCRIVPVIPVQQTLVGGGGTRGRCSRRCSAWKINSQPITARTHALTHALMCFTIGRPFSAHPPPTLSVSPPRTCEHPLIAHHNHLLLLLLPPTSLAHVPHSRTYAFCFVRRKTFACRVVRRRRRRCAAPPSAHPCVGWLAGASRWIGNVSTASRRRA